MQYEPEMVYKAWAHPQDTLPARNAARGSAIVGLRTKEMAELGVPSLSVEIAQAVQQQQSWKHPLPPEIEARADAELAAATRAIRAIHEARMRD